MLCFLRVTFLLSVASLNNAGRRIPLMGAGEQSREEPYILPSAFSHRYAAVLVASPERRKASRSAFMVSAWVVGQPCGKPL
jgi:hypothetical protein